MLFPLALPARADLPSWDDPEWYAAPPNPLNLEMTPDIARGVQSTIGPAGGSFAVTGATGDVYALTVPEGALFTDTTIAMIPVAQARGLPEGSGPFSGVILQPNGLELAKTGWLEITPATPVPPEKLALWGLYGTGQDARGEVNWPGAGDRIVIPIDHFSGAGFGIADLDKLKVDKWQQTRTEDRVRSQIAEALRAQRAVALRNPDGDASDLNRANSELMDRLGRILSLGHEQILRNPAASCKDVTSVVGSILALDRTRELMGIPLSDEQKQGLSGLFSRYWSVCFQEEIEICLKTGDLKALVTFAMKFERMRAFLGETAAEEGALGASEGEVRAALERCGQFELEVASQGTYSSDGGGSGTYAFKARVPLRLTFDSPSGFSYRIYGEAPPTDITITPNLPEYTTYEGHRISAPVIARLTTYEFTTDDTHKPVKLEALVAAPTIIADFVVRPPRFPTIPVPTPLVEGAWYLAHREDLGADAYKLRRFRPQGHPVLWEMQWDGTGQEDDAVMTDNTRFRLIHIAQ
jgi:hypothetical protein